MIKPIGKIYTDMPDKFGVPRQAGNVVGLTGKIMFEPEFAVREAFDGIEEFSHLWVLWEFNMNKGRKFSPTVRPPRLNGNTRKGVFATRSPFRPNSIGISCVKLLKAEYTKKHGMVLTVSGIDMVSETPVLDIKPYIAYTDSHPEATQGFAGEYADYGLEVEFPENLLKKIPAEKQAGIIGVLEQDPRPSYHNDPDREYGVGYIDFNIKFKVNNGRLLVTEVCRISPGCSTP